MVHIGTGVGFHLDCSSFHRLITHNHATLSIVGTLVFLFFFAQNQNVFDLLYKRKNKGTEILDCQLSKAKFHTFLLFAWNPVFLVCCFIYRRSGAGGGGGGGGGGMTLITFHE